MLRLLLSKAQACKAFWKSSKPCHFVSIIFQSLRLLHHFVFAKLATSNIRVENIWLNPWNMGTYLRVLTTTAIQRIPTWKGLDGFQKSLCPISIGRVNSKNFAKSPSCEYLFYQSRKISKIIPSHIYSTFFLYHCIFTWKICICH